MDETEGIDQAIKTMIDGDMCAAEKACTFLEGLVRDNKDFDVIKRIREESVNVKSNFLVYLRFMKLLCGIFSLGEEEFRRCQEVGAIGDVVAFCTTNDVLVQMNTIDLLIYLTNTHHGFEYLCEHKLLLWLISTSCGVSLVPDPMISAHALRVLSKIFLNAENKRFDLLSNMSTELIDHFLDRMCKHFDHGNFDERLAAVGALTAFACIHVSTLEMVLNDDVIMAGWLDQMVSGDQEMEAAVLNGVAQILGQTDNAYVSSPVHVSGDMHFFTAVSEEKEAEFLEHRRRVTNMKQDLVKRVGEAKGAHPAAYLLRLATQPVEVTRHAAVNLMRAIAEQPMVWGLQMLFETDCPQAQGSNFETYLQDPHTETSKEGKELKFALVQAIAHNPAHSLLPQAVISRIYSLVKQGAYFEPSPVGMNEASPAMMVEG